MSKAITALSLIIGLVFCVGVRCYAVIPGTVYNLSNQGVDFDYAAVNIGSGTSYGRMFATVSGQIKIEWTRDLDGSIIDGPAVIHRYNPVIEMPGIVITFMLDGGAATVDLVNGQLTGSVPVVASGSINCSGYCTPLGMPVGSSAFGPVPVPEPRSPLVAGTVIMGSLLGGGISFDLGLGPVSIDPWWDLIFTGIESPGAP